MAPGSIFHHISFWSTILVSYLLPLQSFTFHSINQKYQKYYFVVYPSLSDLTLQITVKGLTTPLSRWVQVGVCLCRYSVAWALSPTGLIPWFSKAEGNTYSTLLHQPFLFKGKTNASSRSSRKNFWCRCRADLHQVKTYQVTIINSHISHYIICHSPLVFLSPTSKMIFEKDLPFLRPSSVHLLCLLLVCSCVGLLALSQWPHQKALTLTLRGWTKLKIMLEASCLCNLSIIISS